MIDKIINKRLEKQGFIKVPVSWLSTLGDIEEKYRELNNVIHLLGEEYNELLSDYIEAASTKDLKENLAEIDDIEEIPSRRAAVAQLYFDTFAIVFEDDEEKTITQ